MALHDPHPFTWWLRKVMVRWVVRPLVWVILGPSRVGSGLPNKGPGVIVANHNSHLDTVMMLSLLSRAGLKRLRPVAAADYFLRNRLLAWFSLNLVGIIPIQRAGSRDPLADCREALEKGWILLFFPEGTRGKPEQRSRFKAGIGRLMKDFPEVPVVPVLLHGLGKSLPKGERVFVPFRSQVAVGQPMTFREKGEHLTESLEHELDRLTAQIYLPQWD